MSHPLGPKVSVTSFPNGIGSRRRVALSDRARRAKLCEVKVHDTAEPATPRPTHKVENPTLHPIKLTLVDDKGRLCILWRGSTSIRSRDSDELFGL